MELPEKCPHCNVVMGIAKTCWIIRIELDYDYDFNESNRIEDQIYECSNCHTLFRLRWKLVSFTELIEKK